MKHLFKALLAIAVCQCAGAIGSLFTAPSIPTWYASLQKPFFSPPNWLFGPVWIALYTLMGISAFLVWKRGLHRKDVRIALSLFALQLALNALWSVLFFGLRSPFLALIEILFLLAAIALTTALFHRIHRRSAHLMLPYLAWTLFAAFLNLSLWLLNP